MLLKDNHDECRYFLDLSFMRSIFLLPFLLDSSYHYLHVTVYISNDINTISTHFQTTNVLCAAESDKGEKYISRTAEEC